MSENSPTAPEAQSNSPPPRPLRRLFVRYVAIGIVGLVIVPVCLDLVFSSPELPDTFIITWQALMDEQSAAQLVKSLKEPSTVDPGWKQDHFPVPQIDLPNPAPQNVPSKYYRGSGEAVRGGMRRVLASSGPTFLPDQVVWGEFRSSNSSEERPPLLKRIGKWLAGSEDSSSRKSSFSGVGSLPSKTLEDWKKAQQNSFSLSDRVSSMAAFDSKRGMKVELHGEFRLQDFKFQGQTGKPESAWGLVNCQTILKPGDALVIVDRFPVKLPAPVLVTVHERWDQMRGRGDLPMQRSFRRWIEGGPELVRKTSRALDAWEKQGPQDKVIPGPAWTETLADGRAATLFAVSFHEKYPNFKWTPEGKPLPEFVPNHGGLSYVNSSRPRGPRALFRVVHAPPAEIGTTPIVDADIIFPFGQIRGDAIYATTRGPADDKKSYVQFVSFPASVLPDGRGEVEVATGYGHWKFFENVPYVESKEPANSKAPQPFSVQLREFDQFGISKLGVNVTVSKKIPPDEDLRILMIPKSGKRTAGDDPPEVYGGAPGSAPDSRVISQIFSRYNKSDVDHFEIETRPTKTLRFTGFVTEPEELKKIFYPPASASK